MKNRTRQAFGGLALWALCPALAAAAPAAEYRVVDSELRILVFSAGALGALGHDHVITSRATTGTVRVGESPADSAIELSLPVESLVVDDPQARAAAGSAFEGEVPEDDRQGTRENMLGSELLAAERYPEVRIVSQSISGEFPNVTVQARIEIRESRHEVALPVSVAFHGDRLIALGGTQISHSDLGLAPFSAGFGTLRVAEDMQVRYRIVAEKSPVRGAPEESPVRRAPTGACNGRGSAPRIAAP